MAGAKRLPGLQLFAPSFLRAGAVRDSPLDADPFGISARRARVVADFLDGCTAFFIRIHQWKPAIA